MKKEIQILNTLIEKLNNKNFNLEAWKSATVVILARLFGENSRKIKEIENIEYDYSSWSLRDTSGESHLEVCKKSGRNILEASILEIEVLGLADKSSQKEGKFNIDLIIKAMENELSMTEFRELKKILNSGETIEEIKEKIVDKFKIFGVEISARILGNILVEEEIRGDI
jgi:hypothetical protein